jgi:transcriptional regulator
LIIIDMSKTDMSKQRADVPYGTLDLLVLKTLETMGEMNGYRIARRIEQVSGDALKLSQGAIYPALIRLEQEGWIRARWRISETNRKVKSYSLTRSGTKQLAAEVRRWEEANALVARFIEAVP